MTKITEASLKSKTLDKILELKNKTTLKEALKQQLIDTGLDVQDITVGLIFTKENPLIKVSESITNIVLDSLCFAIVEELKNSSIPCPSTND